MLPEKKRHGYSPFIPSPLNPERSYQVPPLAKRNTRRPKTAAAQFVAAAARKPNRATRAAVSPTERLLRQKAAAAWRSEVLSRHASLVSSRNPRDDDRNAPHVRPLVDVVTSDTPKDGLVDNEVDILGLVTITPRSPTRSLSEETGEKQGHVLLPSLCSHEYRNGGFRNDREGTIAATTKRDVRAVPVFHIPILFLVCRRATTTSITMRRVIFLIGLLCILGLVHALLTCTRSIPLLGGRP
ncbi:hypothetical protein QBC46DRAFT_408504 [Diplogelasinospora grovesii]|uniref:Transmembrane protein n=1 Tax=Diplogelasinospora grovesii TaxID=303347 RepID=A0AAN6N6H4_9PEZI|nr:hypothetical protein QBC46DRAFT_408504 [Diplogelasinospora grovesii]